MRYALCVMRLSRLLGGEVGEWRELDQASLHDGERRNGNEHPEGSTLDLHVFGVFALLGLMRFDCPQSVHLLQLTGLNQQLEVELQPLLGFCCLWMREPLD